MGIIFRLTTLLPAAALAFGVYCTPDTAIAATYPISTLDGSQGPTYDPAGTTPWVTNGAFHAQGLAANGDFTIIRVTPEDIGMPGLLLGQITGTSYDAKTNVAGLADWRVKTYTVSTGEAPYGVRVESPTTFSGTDWTNHNLQAFDRIAAGDGSFDVQGLENIEAIYGHFLAAATQEVLYFEITAGATDSGYDYDAMLNNITIQSSAFETAVITAVPEPASFGLLTLPFLTLLRRRRSA